MNRKTRPSHNPQNVPRSVLSERSMDSRTVELRANSIDLAFICDTYHHFEFPLKTMASLHQAMKPGGRVIIIDFKRIEGQSSDWVLNHVRAGQGVVEEEVRQAGFRKVKERSLSLTENYFVEFQMIPKSQALKTSLLPGVGGVAELTGAPGAPKQGGKIVFDITISNKPEEVNAGLERAARVLNLYGAGGMNTRDVQISLVLHGDAAFCVQTDASATDSKNPNRELIAALNRAGVEIFVCGQTLARKKIPHSNVSEGVTIATSAMTALVNHQVDGYSLMTVH
ncbi:DsrE family protein [Planctomicrobium sp. SH668]|uniref:DsrE family protein n=1 Tax=Planctomicrobium sp. SH668 TaxID=3448126 RepID=UPI003F5C674A